MISRVTDRLVKTLDFQAALTNLIEGATELLEVERASIMILDSASGTLTIRVAKGLDEEIVRRTRVRVGEGIAGKVAETAEPLVVWDVRQLGVREDGEWSSENKANSGLCVPLAIHGKVLGVMNFNHKSSGTPFDASEIEFALLIANQAAIALYNALLYEEFQDKLAIESELKVAHSIQKGFLPQADPELAGYDISARCVMSHGVGGDYCGFVRLEDGRLAVAVGDVEGHGVGSALLMANARACLSTSLKRGDSLAEALRLVNGLLTENPESARLMTLQVGILAPSGDRMELVSAGHPLPLRFRRGRCVPGDPRPRNPPLGVDPTATFLPEEPIPIERDDVLLLLTDGLLETADATETELGWAGIRRLVEGAEGESAAEMIDEILRGVGEFRAASDPSDDCTLVILKRSSRREA